MNMVLIIKLPIQGNGILKGTRTRLYKCSFHFLAPEGFQFVRFLVLFTYWDAVTALVTFCWFSSAVS